MYMGELVRCILVDLTKRHLLFNGQGSQKLFTPKSFQTAYISAIESDKKNDYILTRQALAAMDLRHATLDDCDMVKLVSFCYFLIEKLKPIALLFYLPEIVYPKNWALIST